MLAAPDESFIHRGQQDPRASDGDCKDDRWDRNDTRDITSDTELVCQGSPETIPGAVNDMGLGRSALVGKHVT